MPPHLCLPDAAAYLAYWEWLCERPLRVHDGTEVLIYPNQFKHAFYAKSSRAPNAKKDRFDLERARRMDWIAAVLGDRTLPSYKRTDSPKEVSRIFLNEGESYAVIIRPTAADQTKAPFITAYVIDRPEVVRAMKSNPLW
jgi:hypothetical protein